MKIERTHIKEGQIMHYVLTDNVCLICQNNPEVIKAYPYKYGGNEECKDCHKSVIDCENFKEK
jgi:hypothetical protein